MHSIFRRINFFLSPSFFLSYPFLFLFLDVLGPRLPAKCSRINCIAVRSHVSPIRPRHFVRRGGLFSTVRAASLSECVRPFRTTSAYVKATTIPFDKQQTRTNVHPLAFTRPSRATLSFHQSEGTLGETFAVLESAIARYHSPMRKIKGQTRKE